jgi:class 3 adenylate cyclase/predicted ATPase
MTFDDILDHAIAMLQRRGRLTYRTLKRQFNLDDDALEDLKEEILYSQPQVVDDAGKGLMWTGHPAAPEPDPQRWTDAESRFHAMLSAVRGRLQRERRVMYRELKHVFGLDDALLAEIRKALAFKRLAIDEDGDGLVWTGETPSTRQPPVATPSQPFTLPPTPPRETEVLTPSNGPTISADAVTPEPTRSAPEAERRHLTVMFCDLADSTTLSQQLDPEDLREVVRAYQATAAEIIQQYEGHMAQYLGDGLLIYFGWPVAHEDDAQRSLHAGLGIVEAITTTLNPRLEAEKGVRLTVRLGVHTGPVVVGEMGGGGRHENLATGETVNVAARLEGLAAPNTVVISQVTARLVRGTFALENLGPHGLKGVAEPLPVFQVRGPLEAHEDERVTAGVPFLVGRDEEVGLLLRRWEQSKAGLGQVVLISGEAGIGKSSLVEVLRAHVRQEGLPRIAYRCSSYHQNSALYPVIAHIERLLDLQRQDDAETKLDKLEQGLRPYSLPLDEVVPLFASLLSVPLHERYPAPTLTPQQQKRQTLDALVAWLLEEGEQQPVLVAWEDLHWADPSTLELLTLVLEQTPTVPMLHVLTSRPEFAPPWPMRSHMTPLLLNRLERPQVEALITHMARGKALPAEVVEHIVTKTDGVPLYVEELTKMLLDSAFLRQEDEGYVLTGSLATVVIPDTLQDSLMARLDQMNTAKDIAQLGAIIGREFAYELLRVISPQNEETLQDGLAKLVEAELLYQRGRPPRARYLFKHALIQDAAYASLLKRTRQQVHRQIAQALEGRFSETMEAQPELVAYHYTEAGVTAPAIDYWQRAAQRAIGRSTYVEAITYLTRALEVLKALPDTSARSQSELDIQLTLGQALTFIRGQASAEVGQAFNRARELCQQIGDEPRLFRVLFGLWHFHVVRAELSVLHALSEELLLLGQRLQDPLYLHGAHFCVAARCFFDGEFDRARQHWEQSFALYEPRQHRDNVFLFSFDLGVFTLCISPHALWHLGYPAQALATGQQALDLAREVSHPFSLAVAQDYVAMLHQFRRDRPAAHELSAAAIALCSEQGFAYYLAWAHLLQGWSLSRPGEDQEGITQMRHGLEALRATGGQVRLPYYLSLMAEACGQAGQVEDGLALVAEALTRAETTEERWRVAELYRLQGDLCLQQAVPDASQAESCFVQALDVARSQQAKSLELRAATSLARMWQSQGKRQDAHDLLAPVYGWFTEGFDTADLKDAKALLQALEA